MLAVEITGVTKWEFSIVSFPDVGHASISLDGKIEFNGKTVGRDRAFEITDLQGGPVLHCSPEHLSRWHTFLGHGGHVIKDAFGQELARIHYGGPFGFRRTLKLDDQEFPMPHRRQIVLPGATIFDERQRVTRAEISHEQHRLAYLGAAYYLWLLSDTSSP